MDFGGIGGRRGPPKKKEAAATDASDAFILAEFEKRFGKRIKLGDDSNTLVLSSAKSQVGCWEIGHFASLLFRPLHTELLNTVPTHHISWGLRLGTHGNGLGLETWG